MRLFKDVTAAAVHADTAIGNDIKKPKKKPVGTAAAAKPSADDAVDVDAFKNFAKATVVKVDETLGLVFGFAIVCKKDGEDYYDLQDDHIPEQSMLEAALNFMLVSRVAKEMHAGEEAGTVVFAFPMTSDIAKALEIETKQTGLLIAMRPSEGMLGKFKSGELTGFSIGGIRLFDEAVD